MKQGIIILTKPSTPVVCCGHLEHERALDRKNRYCCPDSWTDGDYLDEYNDKCSKRFTVYREFTLHQVTIHVPNDATLAEMVTLIYEQVEKIENKLETKVFFRRCYFWSEWNQAPKEIPKEYRRKVWNLLFKLPQKMFPTENRYYEKIKQTIPPNVLFSFGEREIHARKDAWY